MPLSAYYDGLDPLTRRAVASAYVAALRELKRDHHPALLPANISETSLIICNRIVRRTALGLRDPAALKAHAIAGLERGDVLGKRPAIRSRHLMVARLNFESKAQNLVRLRQERLGQCDAGQQNTAMHRAHAGLIAAQQVYVGLLVAWSEQS